MTREVHVLTKKRKEKCVCKKKKEEKNGREDKKKKVVEIELYYLGGKTIYSSL